jgi:hypothetical protein
MRARKALAGLIAALLAVASIGIGEATATEGAPAAAYSVTARSSKPSVVAGNPVKIRTTVSPNAAGQNVQLQEYYNGRWNRVRGARLDSSSSAVIRVRPRQRGIKRLRVVKPASNGLTKGVSREVRIKVLAWKYLDTMSPSDWNARLDESTGTLGGVSYLRSLRFWFQDNNCDYPYYQTYSLSRSHERLKLTAGIDDGAPAGLTSSFKIYGDDVVLGSATLSRGSRSRFDVSVRGVASLKLEWNNAGCRRGMRSGYFGVFGDPQLLW